VTESAIALQAGAAVVGAAVAASIGIFQHYGTRNLVSLVVGFAIFVAVLGWTDPNPDLHTYKVLLAGIGAGMWISAVREEVRRRRERR
jgi:peptidoglycan/LPS O-acetylase OafA/YrhL